MQIILDEAPNVEVEILSDIQLANEYIMVRSRTNFGLDPKYLAGEFRLDFENDQ